MKLVHLTILQFQILALADDPKQKPLSIAELEAGLETENGVEWLAKRYPTLDLHFFKEPHWAKEGKELNNLFARHINVLDSGKTGIHNNGLLLLAWLLTNAIQSRDEWKDGID